MTRVIFIKSHFSGNGGAEKYSQQLVRAFLEKGCEVTVLSSGDSIDNELNCETISVSSNRKWNLAQLKAFEKGCHRYLQQHSADIIFGMDRTCEQTHYRAGNGVHAAYLDRRKSQLGPWGRFTLSSNPFHRTTLAYEKKAFESNQLKTLFTNSEMVRRELLHYYQIDEDKISVIHNGVAFKELLSVFNGWEEKRDGLLKSRNLEPNRFQLLFVGNGYRRKGLDCLIEALALLDRDDIELSVVGKDKELEAYQYKAHKLRLGDRIHFFGEQPLIYPFYQYSDALVLPTTYDPFANVTIEALALGLYTITTADNGGHEILHPDCGHTLEAATPELLAEAIKEAVEQPKTAERALKIRESVRGLDFTKQLMKMVDQTLGVKEPLEAKTLSSSS